MAIDIYGDTYIDNWDYARKIITKGASAPFYHFNITAYNGKIKTSFWHPFEGLVEQGRFMVPGLYVIYQNTTPHLIKPTFECHYVGSTDHCVYNRFYRYGKELLNMSRPDEDHSGGRKARLAGVKPDHLYVTFMPWSELPIIPNVRLTVNIKEIDQTMAILLKSRFNSIKRY